MLSHFCVRLSICICVGEFQQISFLEYLRWSFHTGFDLDFNYESHYLVFWVCQYVCVTYIRAFMAVNVLH